MQRCSTGLTNGCCCNFLLSSHAKPFRSLYLVPSLPVLINYTYEWCSSCSISESSSRQLLSRPKRAGAKYLLCYVPPKRNAGIHHRRPGAICRSRQRYRRGRLVPPGGLRERLLPGGACPRNDPVGREPDQRLEQRGAGEDAAGLAGVRSQGAQDGLLPGTSAFSFVFSSRVLSCLFRTPDKCVWRTALGQFFTTLAEPL